MFYIQTVGRDIELFSADCDWIKKGVFYGEILFIIRLRNVFETHKPWSSRFRNSYLKFMGLVLKEGRNTLSFIHSYIPTPSIMLLTHTES
jgi:hypothetical protein